MKCSRFHITLPTAENPGKTKPSFPRRMWAATEAIPHPSCCSPSGKPRASHLQHLPWQGLSCQPATATTLASDTTQGLTELLSFRRTWLRVVTLTREPGGNRSTLVLSPHSKQSSDYRNIPVHGGTERKHTATDFSLKYKKRNKHKPAYNPPDQALEQLLGHGPTDTPAGWFCSEAVTGVAGC